MAHLKVHNYKNKCSCGSSDPRFSGRSQVQERKYFRAPRLKEFPYQDNYAYFITVCTFNKNRYFSDKKVVDETLKVLKESADKNGLVLYAYCFMPDHLHFLALGEEHSLLGKFLRGFKQKSGYWFKSLRGKHLWQRSYYDHVLRKEESLEEVSLYILNNPVRKELVRDFREYENLGSFVFNVRDL